MKKEYPPLTELKKGFAVNKVIPKVYEESILRALSHYPELKNTNIHFKLKDKHPVPYNTVSSSLKALSKRKYIISILEKAEPPTEMALFKNLPEEARLGVIGHELGHIIEFSKKSLPSLLFNAIKFSSPEETRKAERTADVHAIEHGLGFELYTHARYIRAIPGYTELRKDIDINYLHPNEILESLKPEELHESNL